MVFTLLEVQRLLHLIRKEHEISISSIKQLILLTSTCILLAHKPGEIHHKITLIASLNGQHL